MSTLNHLQRLGPSLRRWCRRRCHKCRNHVIYRRRPLPDYLLVSNGCLSIPWEHPIRSVAKRYHGDASFSRFPHFSTSWMHFLHHSKLIIRFMGVVCLVLRHWIDCGFCACYLQNEMHITKRIFAWILIITLGIFHSPRPVRELHFCSKNIGKSSRNVSRSDSTRLNDKKIYKGSFFHKLEINYF